MLEVGSAYTRLGARVDDDGFDRYERRLEAVRRDARRPVEAELRADADTRGFDRFDRRLDKTERETSRFGGKIKGAFAMIGPAAGLAAGAGVAALGLFGKSAIDAASDVNESLSKNRVLFGDHAKGVEQFADRSAKAFGISRKATLEYTGTFGNLFRALELGPKKSADLSVGLTKLAADMASFNNSTPEEALEALRSGLVGETEPLRRFGVNMNDAALRAEALKQGLVKNTKEALDPQAKALAAVALATKQTSAAHGDFARTSDGAANRGKILQARFDDLKSGIGERLLPVWNRFLGFVTRLWDEFDKGKGPVAGVVRGVKAVVGAIGDAVRWVNGAARDIGEFFTGGSRDATGWKDNVVGVFDTVISTGRRLWTNLKRAFAGIGDDLADVGRAFVKIERVISSVMAPIVRRIIPGVADVIEGLAGVVRNVVKVIAGLLSGDFSKAWDGVKGIVEGAFKAVKGVIRVVTAPIREGLERLGDVAAGAFERTFGRIPGIAGGFVNKIIDVINILPGVDIGHVSWGKASARDVVGPGATQKAQYLFAGGVVNAPIAIVGEEAPAHPEVIIPSNPRYRGRALDLFAHAGRMLGVPGFAKGGVLRRIAGAADDVGDFASGIIDRLPGNPFKPPIAGLGGELLDRVGDFIRSKAAAAFRSLTQEGVSGQIGKAVGGTLGRAAELASRFGLRISSTYRSPADNAAAGGVPNSLHTHGSPRNPGAIDLVGSGGSMSAALGYAVDKWHPQEAMIHDVGSGLHLHLGFFAKGGVRGRRKGESLDEYKARRRAERAAARRAEAKRREAARHANVENAVRTTGYTPREALYLDQLDSRLTIAELTDTVEGPGEDKALLDRRIAYLRDTITPRRKHRGVKVRAFVARDLKQALDDRAALNEELDPIDTDASAGEDAPDDGGTAEAMLAQALQRAGNLAADLKAARANLSAFAGPGDLGAGGANAFAALGFGTVGAGFTPARGGFGRGLVVQPTFNIHSFLPPTGRQAFELAAAATGAFNAQPYSQNNRGRVG